MAAHSRPAPPAFFHMTRSMMPSSCHCSRCGTNSVAKNLRACSSRSTRSSLIHAGRGTLRTSMCSCVLRAQLSWLGSCPWRHSKCLGGELHGAGGAGLDPLQVGRAFGQQPVHEKAGGGELGFEAFPAAVV